VPVSIGPLKNIKSHLAFFATSKPGWPWLAHHTRKVSETLNSEGDGYESESALDQLTKMKPHYDLPVDEGPVSPSKLSMMGAGRIMVMQHSAELRAMAARSNADPAFD
jgi:hypothetical protein